MTHRQTAQTGAHTSNQRDSHLVTLHLKEGKGRSCTVSIFLTCEKHPSHRPGPSATLPISTVTPGPRHRFPQATSTRLRPSEVTKLTPGGSKKCRLLTLASILTLSPNTPSSPKFLACAAIHFRGIDVPHLSQPSQRGEIPQWSLATRFWTHNENWPS